MAQTKKPTMPKGAEAARTAADLLRARHELGDPALMHVGLTVAPDGTVRLLLPRRGAVSGLTLVVDGDALKVEGA